MIFTVDVNELAVLVAAVIQMAIGAFWYSSSGFGKQWISLMGWSEKKVQEIKQQSNAKMYALGFLTALVFSYVLAHVIVLSGADTAVAGAQVGFWIWVGFIATVLAGSVLWEGRPTKLYYLNVGYYLVALIINGALLAMWM